MLWIQVHEIEWQILLKREKKRILCLQSALGFQRHLYPPKKFKITSNLHSIMYLFTI